MNYLVAMVNQGSATKQWSDPSSVKYLTSHRMTRVMKNRGARSTHNFASWQFPELADMGSTKLIW